MSDVETLAIDTVDIISNTSLLTDETLVHRLGLIVINSNVLYNNDSNNTIYNNYSNNDIIEFGFTLNITCLEESMLLTADMIETNHENVYPVHGDTIIANLYRGDKINLSGTIKRGIGRDHAKWMPVSAIGYNTENNIAHNTENNIDNEKIKIYMIIESVGSLSSSTILEVAKKIITEKQTGNNEKNDIYLNKFKRAYLL
jgi:DNA-directed RNA polymerase II subunit RPB3